MRLRKGDEPRALARHLVGDHHLEPRRGDGQRSAEPYHPLWTEQGTTHPVQDVRQLRPAEQDNSEDALDAAIGRLTLDQLNAAVRKYIDPRRLALGRAGDFVNNPPVR